MKPGRPSNCTPWPLTHLSEAIKNLAPGDRERAALLGVSVNTVRSYYLRRKAPPLSLVLLHAPLAEAFFEDVRAYQKAQETSTR